jgi:glycosyltransferase involved in cell wall biosynthesis
MAVSISVVITTFNRAALLEQTLGKMRSQAFAASDELIVVDNASSDRTPEVIETAAREFPVPLRYLRESEPGKTPALNAGIAAARGDVLALTDDDVLVAEDWIAAIRVLFSDPSLDLAGGRVDPFWESPPPRWLQVEGKGQYTEMASPLALQHYGAAQPLGARTAVGANLIVRRRSYDALGGFAAHLGRRRGTLLCGEDHDFCERAVAAGMRCEYRPEILVRHWVPASRGTLRYHARWFFWSGVTNAIIEAPRGSSGRALRRVPRYFWRRLLASPFIALTEALLGRPASAACELMQGIFAFGYIRQRLTSVAGAASEPAVGATQSAA